MHSMNSYSSITLHTEYNFIEYNGFCHICKINSRIKYLVASIYIFKLQTDVIMMIVSHYIILYDTNNTFIESFCKYANTFVSNCTYYKSTSEQIELD